MARSALTTVRTSRDPHVLAELAELLDRVEADEEALRAEEAQAAHDDELLYEQYVRASILRGLRPHLTLRAFEHDEPQEAFATDMEWEAALKTLDQDDHEVNSAIARLWYTPGDELD